MITFMLINWFIKYDLEETTIKYYTIPNQFYNKEPLRNKNPIKNSNEWLKTNNKINNTIGPYEKKQNTSKTYKLLITKYFIK